MTPLTQNTAVSLLTEAMDEVNAQRKKDERVTPTPLTVLVGAGAPLDSLLLLNFLVAAEERLEAAGAEVSLVDLLASQDEETSPLRTFRALAAHLVKATNDQGTGGGASAPGAEGEGVTEPCGLEPKASDE